MEVVPGFHVGERTRGGRVYLLADAAGCVLVDTGAADGTLGAGQLLEAAGRRASEVRLILLTHAHPGHAGNAAELRRLTGAPLAASDAAARALAHPEPSRRGPLGRLLGGSEPAAPVLVDWLLEAGEEIDLAGGITVVGSWGHAAGHLSFHLHGPDALCLGDAASVGGDGIGPPPLRPCADLVAAAVSLRRLRAIGARVLAPGHGRPSVDGRLPARRPR
ncbi:MAG TPA: MBL fold metallo-hydrolase [Candidatus Dormibacteraeota bacterium]|jgi:glyoxylase-like metal-dependent hydrolase (beta-lactamase superfamily II)